MYVPLCSRLFFSPFVTFQVSRDFDLKFEKWGKGGLDGEGRERERDCYFNDLFFFFRESVFNLILKSVGVNYVQSGIFLFLRKFSSFFENGRRMVEESRDDVYYGNEAEGKYGKRTTARKAG